MRHLLGCGVVQTVLRTVCTKELRSRPRHLGKGSIQALHPDKSDQKLGFASAWAVFLGRDSPNRNLAVHFFVCRSGAFADVSSDFGGAGENRTHDRGFADLGLTTWLPRRLAH